MYRFVRIAPLSLLVLAVMLWTAGCKSNQNANNGQTAADNSATGAQDSASDPASANLAPISNASTGQDSGQNSTPQSAAYQPQAAAPAGDNGSYSGGSDNGSAGQYDDADYGEQPEYTAQQPPPPLPEYQQPPDPGDDYLWTPGYWSYAQQGYYWVPGAWVQAPYQGALWTPGYWGYTHGHYGFFHGYWGPHIGFYGGINYGFGYVGIGYQGGYWNHGNFYYNRAVNNINVTVVHNVYNRTVIVNNNVRVSYNGPGGIPSRPRPAEIAALREPHAPPMTAQLQVRREASTNRENFANVNHGRPANPVIAKPVMADRDVHPVAAPAPRMQPAPERGAPQARPNEPARGNEPARQENRPANAPARPEARPNAPQSRPEARPTQPERPAEPNHPAPQKPAPHPQAANPRPEEHPAARASRPEERPAPRKAAPEKPEPKREPAPKPKPEDEHPQ